MQYYRNNAVVKNYTITAKWGHFSRRPLAFDCHICWCCCVRSLRSHVTPLDQSGRISLNRPNSTTASAHNMMTWCRRETVQVRGDLADLQARQRRGRGGNVRRLHGGVQDIRPRGPGLHQRRRNATRSYITRYDTPSPHTPSTLTHLCPEFQNHHHHHHHHHKRRDYRGVYS